MDVVFLSLVASLIVSWAVVLGSIFEGREHW